jgi:hypothetical protein
MIRTLLSAKPRPAAHDRPSAGSLRAVALPLAILLLLAVGGCGDSDRPGGDPPGQGAAAGGQATGPGESIASLPGAGDEVEVIISGGSHSGTYRADGDLSCFVDDTGWSAGLARTEGSGMTEVFTLISDVPAGGGTTEQVDLTLFFGPSGEQGITGIGGLHGGTGQGTVERQGNTALIRLTGTSADGARIAAVFRCASVETI